MNLRTADVDLIDDAHDVLANFWRRVDHERVRFFVRPDRDRPVRAARRGAALGRDRAAKLRRERSRQLLGIRVLEVANLCLGAVLHWRVQVDDDGSVAQSRSLGPAQDDAVRARIRDELNRWRARSRLRRLCERG